MVGAGRGARRENGSNVDGLFIGLDSSTDHLVSPTETFEHKPVLPLRAYSMQQRSPRLWLRYGSVLIGVAQRQTI
ncbi:hypothetical protein N7465_009073 [Penicillium sp. CMV-2018d]|nr:hypothetical protein N7465_009073 [Penicillium sp. CMV-2018d]